MQERELYSIEEARALLGGIDRNTIYELIRTASLPSVVIGRQRFIRATKGVLVLGDAFYMRDLPA